MSELNTRLRSTRQRINARLGTVSMYRLTFFALVALQVLALVFSLTDLIGVEPLGIVLTWLILTVTISGTDLIAHHIIGRQWRFESSALTALILLFIVPVTVGPNLGGVAILGVLAAASKYVLAWRGRHIFNPAAFAAAVGSLIGVGQWWWVATPALAIPVALLGFVVVWRIEKLRVVGLFVLVAVLTSGVFIFSAGGVASFSGSGWLFYALAQTPILFLGAFMLPEPLTLPPRRRQQLVESVVVGVLVGWPLSFGFFHIGAAEALLVGNLLAFIFTFRTAVQLRLRSREFVTPTVQELSFIANRPLKFVSGQYLELEVPHAHPDARGTRREFSIVSAPGDAPLVQIAYRDGGQKHPSSYKKALAAAEPGAELQVTGVWGDFVLPSHNEPLLLVAAGVGITPFVSQLRDLQLRGVSRDIVLVYVASSADELAFRDRLAETGARVVAFTHDEPAELPATWSWAGGERLTEASLRASVPDIPSRHAFISGPPSLIADLDPALTEAKSVTTDAFAGY